MDTVILSSALLVSSLCKPSSSIALLFGLSVALSAVLTKMFVRISEKLIEGTILLFAATVFSVCVAIAFSRSVGSVFSGEADRFFFALTGIGSALVSFFTCGKHGGNMADTLKNVLPIVPLSFCVGILRELFGEGSIFGREVNFLSKITVNSLGGYCGGLLVISIFIGMVLTVCGKRGGENGT